MRLKQVEDLLNRIDKNLSKLGKVPSLKGTTAMRIYDRDIPEAPFIVEKFNSDYVIWDRSREDLDAPEKMLAMRQALDSHFAGARVFWKKRYVHSLEVPIEVPQEQPEIIHVIEEGLKFELNLTSYKDVGLFLDHRPFRKWVKKMEGQTFLNLFCYTSSVSVAAATAGFKTTNVDLSKNYLEWAQRNFSNNEIPLSEHSFIHMDVKEWLTTQEQPQFDVIFIDPPTVSMSKRSTTSFNVERDHGEMLLHLMSLLKPKGVLYFSTNYRKFKLDLEYLTGFEVTNMTKESIPLDFHDKKIHQLWQLRRPHQKEHKIR